MNWFTSIYDFLTDENTWPRRLGLHHGAIAFAFVFLLGIVGWSTEAFCFVVGGYWFKEHAELLAVLKDEARKRVVETKVGELASYKNIGRMAWMHFLTPLALGYLAWKFHSLISAFLGLN